MKTMKDYYKILGIKETAHAEDIRARWIELIRKFHPDGQTVGGAEAERLKEINEAYEVLKHPSGRAYYDLQRAYQRKKKRLYLQRVITPPAVFIILLFLGLVYLQRSSSVRPPKSSLPSTRGYVQNKTNPLSPPVVNELNVPNQTNPRNLMNLTNQQDEIDRMNQIDQRESPRHPNPNPTPKSRHSNTQADQIDQTSKVNETNEIDQMGKTDQTNEINESNQTNQKDQKDKTNQKHQPAPMSISKKRKPSPLFAKAKTSVTVKNATLLPSEPSHTEKLAKTSQPTETNETNQTNDLNDMNAPKDPNALNHLNELNQTDQKSESNQIIAQLDQLSPTITEEEVNQFLQLYIMHYVRQDIDGFLSLFSPRALQNGRDGIDEIKKIYSDFFHQSHELEYHLEDTRIAIYHEALIHGLFYEYAVTVEARYQLDQTLIKNGEKKFWRGDIRWVLVTENEALKVLHLDFKPEKSD